MRLSVDPGGQVVSAVVPPERPAGEVESDLDRLRELEEALLERLKRVRAAYSQYAQPPSPLPQSVNRSSLSFWVPSAITAILQGLTLAGIIGVAFWLGSLNTTVNNTSNKVDKFSEKVDKLSEKVDGLSSRTAVMETKLESVDKKLDQLTTSGQTRQR
jgi:uncharacterized coiled-coil protein SlyX